MFPVPGRWIRRTAAAAFAVSLLVQAGSSVPNAGQWSASSTESARVSGSRTIGDIPTFTVELHRRTAGKRNDVTAARVLPCYGDGRSGARVEAIFAHAVEVTDQAASAIASIPSWAAEMDTVFNESARRTGSIRHVRWLTNADCSLVVNDVRLSAAGVESLTGTIDELEAMGFNDPDRKYVVWVDSARYCGVAEIREDDRPGPENVNDLGHTFARIDRPCWGMHYSVEAHELMHTLGGVQLSAPHSTGAWHCTDENDRMCLSDSGARPLTYPCPTEDERLFDCGHDDYFTTASVPAPYLASYWNTAASRFLERTTPDACVYVSSDTRRPRRRAVPRLNDVSACVPGTAIPGT